MAEFIVSGQPPKQSGTSIIISAGEPVGHVQQTVSTAAVALSTIPLKANKVLIITETDTLRWRDDGTDPTSTVGMILYPGNALVLDSRASINNFKAIRDTSSSSDITLNAAYYAK